MGRFDSSRRPAAYNEAPEFHPIWRGVGFAMMVLIPIISYAASTILFNLNLENNWVAVPRDLLIPAREWVIQGFGRVLLRIGLDPYLLIKIIMAVIIGFVIYAIFLVVTFVSNRFFGAPRYGPMDAPPIRRKVRRSR